MKDSTVAELDDLLRRGKTARSKLEPVWYLNLAYYVGEQWVAWDGRNLFRPRLKPNRITIVDNRIQPCVRTEVAKMTKNRPVFTISPTTPDEEDLHAADLGEQLMRYLWNHLNLHELTSKALMWSRICGAGFLKCFFDPTLGEGTDVVVGPTGDILTGPGGKPIRAGEVDTQQLAQSLGMPPGAIRSRQVNQGDIRCEVRSPFQMFVDPIADSFPEAEWLIEENVQSVDSVQRRYGVTLPADTTANPGLIEARMGAVLAGAGQYKGVKVREYWCKPCAAHPKGRRAVWSKDQILFEDNNPFDSMPYVMLAGIAVPGRLWPTCVVEQLRGPQTELNKVQSQIAENRNRVGNPTILASKQAVQDPDKFTQSTTMPGGIYFYDDLGSPNTVPTYLQAPPLPQYVIDSIATITDSIQEISGQHEVSSAQVPPGVTAASAINLLLEADDTRLAPAIADYEYQLGKFGQKILKLAAHYYTDARTIRIAGDNGTWQIFDFRGAMLRDNTHVQVQAGSAFPQSKAAKQAAMQDLLTFFVQSGNAPHGRQLAQFLQDWGVGGAERLIEEYTLDQTQVERENSRMYQGQQVPINDFDNDQAHIDGHQDEQKSQRYEQQNPPVKQLFDQHVAEHKQRLAQQQQAQMQLEMQAQGGQAAGQPPPPGQQQLDVQAGGLPEQIQAAQAQHQIAATGAQQGQQMSLDSAMQAQQQRHAEEQHQQKLRHAEEQHQQRLSQGAKNARDQGDQGRKAA